MRKPTYVLLPLKLYRNCWLLWIQVSNLNLELHRNYSMTIKPPDQDEKTDFSVLFFVLLFLSSTFTEQYDFYNNHMVFVEFDHLLQLDKSAIFHCFVISPSVITQLARNHMLMSVKQLCHLRLRLKDSRLCRSTTATNFQICFYISSFRCYSVIKSSSLSAYILWKSFPEKYSCRISCMCSFHWSYSLFSW